MRKTYLSLSFYNFFYSQTDHVDFNTSKNRGQIDSGRFKAMEQPIEGKCGLIE
jgi:hypothetical protein